MTFFLKNTENLAQVSISHVHSGPRLIDLFYKDIQANTLHRATFRKDFALVQTATVSSNTPIKDVEFHCWYRPIVHDKTHELDFTGACIVGGKYHHFDIKNNTLFIGKEFKPSASPKFTGLKALDGITIEQHVQRTNTLFVCGVDERYHEQVFMEVCIASDKALRRYHLRSDQGDLKVNTINLDSQSKRVYVAGDITTYSDQDKVLSVTPYFETFFIG